VKISDVFRSSKRKLFSFEFFPPKTDAGQQTLERTIRELAELTPAFVSVTYGAGGSTRSKTIELVRWIEREAHLTADAGQERFVRTAGGFGYACDLVGFIRKRFGPRLCLGGAGNPEGHVECRDLDQDIMHLKAKVDAGLDFVVTQLFFDNRVYFDFVARARAAGINVPIVPGLMPIRNVAGIERMTKLSGASIPAALNAELQRCRDDDAAVAALGIAQTTAQAVELLHGGAPGIHFYTLNQSPATRVILTALKTARLA